MEAKLLRCSRWGAVNVSELCCRLEVSRQTFYKYRRRWAAEGPAGLMERTRRPDRSPNQIEGWLETRLFASVKNCRSITGRTRSAGIWAVAGSPLRIGRRSIGPSNGGA